MPPKPKPKPKPKQLLVDQVTFDAWFSTAAANPCSNVSRRGTELYK